MNNKKTPPVPGRDAIDARNKIVCRVLDYLVLALSVLLALMLFDVIHVSGEIALLTALIIAVTEAVLLLLTKRRTKRKILFLREENARNSALQRKIIFRFASLIEHRDASSCGHVERVSGYVELIANRLRDMGYSKSELTDDALQNIAMAAPVHDIGKLRIPESILLKPQRLTDEEYEIVKAHAKDSVVAIQKTFAGIQDQAFLNTATEMALYHHEHWDGTGYPCGLSASDIPISARILAVADVFDVVVNTRCYKNAASVDEGFAVLEEAKGKQFDPCIVDVFIQARSEIEAIMHQIKDETGN